jgi:hypothetical protein
MSITRGFVPSHRTSLNRAEFHSMQLSTCQHSRASRHPQNTTPSLGFPRRLFHRFCEVPLQFSHPPLLTMSARPATASVAPAVFRQLVAMLQLIERLSLSLSTSEIRDVQRCLAHAYDSMGAIVAERNLAAEGITFAREFNGCSPNSLLNSVYHSQLRYGYCRSRQQPYLASRNPHKGSDDAHP